MSEEKKKLDMQDLGA